MQGTHNHFPCYELLPSSVATTKSSAAEHKVPSRQMVGFSFCLRCQLFLHMQTQGRSVAEGVKTPA